MGDILGILVVVGENTGNRKRRVGKDDGQAAVWRGLDGDGDVQGGHV